jgi:leucyl aminopeptidase
MVLSDTLVIASREKPALLLDFATLTGAALRALDTGRSAFFANSPKLMTAAHQAGEESGERVWGFPMGEDYVTHLKSRVADVRQCSTTNYADHIYAATFLSHFVEKGVPWVHLDLSSCEHKGGLGLIESDTTGFGLRWARALAQKWL